MYKQFARNCIVGAASLRILSFSAWDDARPTTQVKKRGVPQSGEYQNIRTEHHLREELPTWVPDWTSIGGCTDVSARTPTYNQGNALTRLAWHGEFQPSVSADMNELTVQGRILTTVYNDKLPRVYRAKTQLQARLNRWEDKEYARLDWIREGDLICAVRACPIFLYLRPYNGKYIMVGRERRLQACIIRNLWPEGIVVDPDFDTYEQHLRNDQWDLKSPRAVEALPQRLFTIV
jgi:hypothetical protein